MRIQPENAEAYYNWGNALKDQGQLEMAAVRWQEALRINPDYAEVHNNLGTVFARRGELVEAVKHFEQAVSLKPDYLDARNNLRKAQALLQQTGGPAGH